MTRLDYLKNASVEEVATVLCDITQKISDNTVEAMDGDPLEFKPCDVCVATKTCNKGNNGFIDWLNKEVTFNDKRLRIE